MTEYQNDMLYKMAERVQRLEVRLQQAEAHIETLTQRLSQYDTPTERSVGAHPALGAVYTPIVDSPDTVRFWDDDLYEKLAESIVQGPTGIFSSEE